MYEQNQNPWAPQEPPRRPVPPNRNSLATAALICGILGLVLSCTFYGGLILGGLALIFGLLSRGGRKRAVSSAGGAVILGTVAVILSIVIIAVSFFIVIRLAGGWENFLIMYQNTMDYFTNPTGETTGPTIYDLYSVNPRDFL